MHARFRYCLPLYQPTRAYFIYENPRHLLHRQCQTLYFWRIRGKTWTYLISLSFHQIKHLYPYMKIVVVHEIIVRLCMKICSTRTFVIVSVFVGRGGGGGVMAWLYNSHSYGRRTTRRQICTPPLRLAEYEYDHDGRSIVWMCVWTALDLFLAHSIVMVIPDATECSHIFFMTKSAHEKGHSNTGLSVGGSRIN